MSCRAQLHDDPLHVLKVGLGIWTVSNATCGLHALKKARNCLFRAKLLKQLLNPRQRRSFPDSAGQIALLVDQLPPSMTSAQLRFAASRYVGSGKLLLPCIPSEETCGRLPVVLNATGPFAVCHRISDRGFAGVRAVQVRNLTIEVASLDAISTVNSTKSNHIDMYAFKEDVITLKGKHISTSDVFKWVNQSADCREEDEGNEEGLGLPTVIKISSVDDVSGSASATITPEAPFEIASPWILCYKFNGEPFYPFEGMSAHLLHVASHGHGEGYSKDIAVKSRFRNWTLQGTGFRSGDSFAWYSNTECTESAESAVQYGCDKYSCSTVKVGASLTISGHLCVSPQHSERYIYTGVDASIVEISCAAR